MYRKLACFLLVWVCVGSMAALADVREELSEDLAFRSAEDSREDLDRAIREQTTLAEKGDTDAQRWLGWAFRDGFGMPADHDKALFWLNKAATQGDAGAMNMLSDMAAEKEDWAQAASWRLKLAEKENHCSFELGLMYEKGQGIPQDMEKALACFQERAANYGDEAALHLSTLYDEGKLIPADDSCRQGKNRLLATAGGDNQQ